MRATLQEHLLMTNKLDVIEMIIEQKPELMDTLNLYFRLDRLKKTENEDKNILFTHLMKKIRAAPTMKTIESKIFLVKANQDMKKKKH